MTKFAASVVNTGCKFAASVVDTGSNFAAGVIRQCTLICEYLRKFLTKFEMTLVSFSGAWGKMTHEKIESKKSCDTVPLKGLSHELDWEFVHILNMQSWPSTIEKVRPTINN
jgi:hypothetical protein